VFLRWLCKFQFNLTAISGQKGENEARTMEISSGAIPLWIKTCEFKIRFQLQHKKKTKNKCQKLTYKNPFRVNKTLCSTIIFVDFISRLIYENLSTPNEQKTINSS
jgi:hypothetical protein